MEIFKDLLPVLTALVGAYFTWVLMKKTKLEEWRAIVNKSLIDKRLAAYDEIIAATRSLAMGGAEILDGQWVKYPVIISDTNYYNDISLKFKFISTNYTHLIDANLANRLTILNNYLVYLENHLGLWHTEDEKPLTSEQLKRFGIIIYPDLQTITSDILQAASDFYFSKIYDDGYLPSSLENKEFKLPDEFSELNLFKHEDQIAQLIGRDKDD